MKQQYPRGSLLLTSRKSARLPSVFRTYPAILALPANRPSPPSYDLNTTVEGMLKMLRRLIGEDIESHLAARQRHIPVKLDPAQIDQILANLCLNARDAIASVGNITFKPAWSHWMRSIAPNIQAFSPNYVLLTISDNGLGMDQETMDRIFDPFFTTKGAGRAQVSAWLRSTASSSRTTASSTSTASRETAQLLKSTFPAMKAPSSRFLKKFAENCRPAMEKPFSSLKTSSPSSR